MPHRMRVRVRRARGREANSAGHDRFEALHRLVEGDSRARAMSGARGGAPLRVARMASAMASTWPTGTSVPKSSAMDSVGAARAVGADHRAAAGHRLDQHVRQPLRKGGQHEYRCAPVIGERVVHVAGEVDIGGDAEIGRHLPQGRLVLALAEHDQARRADRPDLRRGPQQRREMFLLA